MRSNAHPCLRRATAMAVAGLLALIVGTLVAPSAQAVTPNYTQIVQDEAYWISTAQIPTSCSAAGGALAWYPYGSDDAAIRPYVANIGATGMLAAGSYYYPMVKAWIDWYFRHLNRPDYNGLSGTVYDYDVQHNANQTACTEHTVAKVVAGVQRAASYDSSDAYAGTFLTLLKQYAQANPGDDAYLQVHASDIQLIANVIVADTRPDGLTEAAPDWNAEYLMDNVEAEAGLSDYSWLLGNVLNDQAGATTYAAKASGIASAIQGLLWTQTQMYKWAADQPTPSWSTWYTDSVAQTWPIRAKLGTASQRTTLWNDFKNHWPDWYNTTRTTRDGSPWCSLGYTAALMGDKIAADTFLNASQTNWIDTNRPWPYTIMDAANRALTAQVTATL